MLAEKGNRTTLDRLSLPFDAERDTFRYIGPPASDPALVERARRAKAAEASARSPTRVKVKRRGRVAQRILRRQQLAQPLGGASGALQLSPQLGKRADRARGVWLGGRPPFGLMVGMQL